MKRIIRFIPLSIAISAFILYVWNVINYKSINDPNVNLQLIIRMRMFLYIFIGGVVVYLLFNLIDVIGAKKSSDIIYPKMDINEEKIESVKKVRTKRIKNRNIDRSKLIKKILYFLQLIFLIVIIFYLVKVLINFKKSQKGVIDNSFELILREIR